jgi:hypothetical protein
LVIFTPPPPTVAPQVFVLELLTVAIAPSIVPLQDVREANACGFIRAAPIPGSLLEAIARPPLPVKLELSLNLMGKESEAVVRLMPFASP